MTTDVTGTPSTEGPSNRTPCEQPERTPFASEVEAVEMAILIEFDDEWLEEP